MKQNSRLVESFAAFSFAILSAVSSPVFADESEAAKVESEQILKYGNGKYLAYIKSDDPAANKRMSDGLKALVKPLTDDTALDPDGVVEIDLSSDTIKPFRYLFAEVTDTDSPLTPEEQKKLQDYIGDNRTVVFDIVTNQGDIMQRFREYIGDLNTGPLDPMPAKHSLTSCFYAISGLGGMNNFDPVYVQRQGVNALDDTSSVIVSRRNWANGWISWKNAPDGAVTKEAMRAGVNMVTCAYTGDYNKDRFKVFETLDNIKE